MKLALVSKLQEGQWGHYEKQNHLLAFPRGLRKGGPSPHENEVIEIQKNLLVHQCSVLKIFALQGKDFFQKE